MNMLKGDGPGPRPPFRRNSYGEGVGEVKFKFLQVKNYAAPTGLDNPVRYGSTNIQPLRGYCKMVPE